MNKITTLGAIADIITGPFGSQLHMEDYVIEGIPVIMPQNIENREVNETGIARITNDDYTRLNRYSTQRNDIIFARRGDVEKHAFIESDDPFLCGTGCLRVRVTSDEVNPLFLSFFLTRIETRRWLVAHAVGTNMPNLNTDILSSVPVEIPEYEIQCRYAAILKALDNKIRNNNRINDNLQQQLRLLYDYWFTQFDFPDSSGKPYCSNGGQMVWNPELKREIPVGWSVKSLADILIKNTEAFDYKSMQPAIDLSVMPSDSIALEDINISDNFNTNLYVMNQGDILFGSIRPYLHKAGFAPCEGVVAGTVHSYKVKKQIDYNFALFTICRNSFFDYAVNVSVGTKMPVISSNSLLDYKVAYCPDVVERFNEISVADVIAKNVQENQSLITLRDWLLPMLMNGQATITD